MKANNAYRIAFPTDEHRPFEDPQAVALAMQIVNDFDPHLRVSGSDGLDFYSLSRFDKDPLRLKEINLQEEINAWKAGQRAWNDATPNADVQWIVGNHEERLIKYLWRQAPVLADLDGLRIDNILGFAELGITRAPADEIVIQNLLAIKHGRLVRKNGGYTARGELEAERYAINVWTGHTHRGGTTFATSRFGTVGAWEAFCLCSQEPEYMVHPDWQLGILMGTILNGVLSTEPVAFFRQGSKLCAIWRGKFYSA